MIISIIGPVANDIDLVVNTLNDESKFQVIDGNTLLRDFERKQLNSLISSTPHKVALIKALEDYFGTVVLTGNLLLDRSVNKYLLDNDHLVVVVARSKVEYYEPADLTTTLKYFGDATIQKYELEQKYQEQYMELAKTQSQNLYYVDLADDAPDMLRLAEYSSDLPPAKSITDDYKLIKQIVTFEEKENMTIEESVKQAMSRLGVSLEDAVDVKAPEPVKTKEPVKAKELVVDIKPNKPQTPKPVQAPQETLAEVKAPENPSIFVKINGERMAILLPVGIKLEETTIAGMKFNTLSVPTPDFNSTRLQELPIVVSKVETPQSTQTPKAPQIANKNHSISNEVTNESRLSSSEDLVALQSKKAELDKKIKDARARGDMNEVESLRKERRATRAKINKLR